MPPLAVPRWRGRRIPAPRSVERLSWRTGRLLGDIQVTLRLIYAFSSSLRPFIWWVSKGTLLVGDDGNQ